MQASFVTLGQLVKFAYDATGILPKKRDEKTSLSSTDVKRIQKNLERLVDEEGSLLDRSGELIRTLHDELSETIHNEKVKSAIGECLLDLLEVYNHVVRDEGTYLPPQDSLQWFASTHAVRRLALSVQKHLVRFNIAADGLIYPKDVNWYLPDISDNSITWPLEKAIQWIYRHCNTSPTHFHCAGKTHVESDSEMRQNLENASNWQKGRNLPSWGALHWNFSRSINRLLAAEGSAARAISSKEKESMLYVLFVARLSTYITNLVHDAYGKDILTGLLSRFMKQRDLLTKDIHIFKDTAESYIEQKKIPQEYHDLVWFDLSNEYWHWFANRLSHCTKTMQELITSSDNNSISSEKSLQLCKKYGEYVVHSVLDFINSQCDLKHPRFFAEALFKGFDLIKNSETTLQEIDIYEAEIREKEVFFCLEWMVHWNRALLHYRNQQDAEAFKHITDAFKLAKYSAGSNQYKIVNQYIELSAKNNSWQNFKKGVAWALYLGISVRWLRKDEPTEENLRSVFNLMKNQKLRYPV